MKKFLLLPALLLCSVNLLFAQDVLSKTKHSEKVQMGFIENKGQLADQNGNLLSNVLFKSVGTGPGIYITTTGLTYVFDRPKNSAVCDLEENTEPVRFDWSKVEMNLKGASIKKENIVTEEMLPGYSNFYLAHCPQGILNVKSFHKITIKDIYPGIDWVLNADCQNRMSHDFIIHPGADPSVIQLHYEGMDLGKLDFDKQNRLAFVSDCGTMYEGSLNVYEKETGKKINADFDILLGIYGCLDVHHTYVPNVTIGYALADYDHTSTLIIDPPLQWTMPQSSTDFDYGYAVSAAHDGTGDVLVTGVTDGINFPTLNAYQGSLSGIEDMIVERINSSGARLWSTYYGGTADEQGKGIASDNSGNCYVIGNTGSANFPALNPIQPNFGLGAYDIAMVKFNSSGVRQFASWFGSGGNEYGTAIAVDAIGNMYLTGYTNSSFFPVTGNAIQGTKNIGYDCFVMKISSTYTLQFATFYGGDDEDKARAITIDATGTNIFITGSTLSGTFPITAGVFQPNSTSAYNFEEAFILKMSTSQVVQWASYCGGNDADFGQGIAVDNTNRVFITGYTLSSTYPVLNPGSGAYIDALIGSPGTHDGFVTEITSDGTAKIWSTYLGGSGVDMGFAIAYDPGIGIYVCGNTASTDFPTHQPIDNNFYQSVQGDAGTSNDMFVCWFDTNDSMRWSTFYGDASSNEAYGICIDALDNIFVTGVDNNDLGLLKFNSSVGVGINTDSFFKDAYLFPNPCAETLFLKVDSNVEGNFSFEIFNDLGQVLLRMEKTIQASDRNIIDLDIKGLAKGTYFLKIYSPNGNRTVKSFVKQ